LTRSGPRRFDTEGRTPSICRCGIRSAHRCRTMFLYDYYLSYIEPYLRGMTDHDRWMSHTTRLTMARPITMRATTDRGVQDSATRIDIRITIRGTITVPTQESRFPRTGNKGQHERRRPKRSIRRTVRTVRAERPSAIRHPRTVASATPRTADS